jgi:arginine decarboxylase
MVKKESLERWTIEDSAELYGIRNWGAGYFDIAPNGDVTYSPDRKGGRPQISIIELLSGVKARGLGMPVLLRIGNILDSQISLLHESFKSAINRFSYKANYRGVYPIKVNQQQQVLEEITEFGKRYHHGLEAGSKAELIAAISMLKDPEACLICNGYKDEEFIDLALFAIKMGMKCFIVLEMPGELDLLLERSEKLGIKPLIGVRTKLSSKAGGHWTESGGDRSIFGLTITELVDVVDKLKTRNMLDCLQLMHFHLGSQVPNIRDIRSAISEACRVYCGLAREGAAMGHLDLGGGLAVDYDGSQTNFVNSRNYTLDEYCADIIETIMSTCDESGIEHPTVITESGRATVAYYSVLLFNVLDVSRFETRPIPDALPAGTNENISNLLDAYKALNLKNLRECYNDAIFYRDEIRQLFKHGDIALRERSLAENIFWQIMVSVSKNLQYLKTIPNDFDGLDAALADTYYSNFSVFQSLPDSWAIGHIFPIMPVHRLNEQPTRQAIIADITCDCDGKIDKFIDPHNVRNTLPVHELKSDEEYFMGAFLVGAYQETLGDLHNLLGDTNVVTIRVDETGAYYFVSEIEGDSVADVLSYVEYDIKAMKLRLRESAESAVRNGMITVNDRAQILKAFEDGLNGYTYFER